MWKRKLIAILVVALAPLTIAGDCEIDFEGDDCEVFCFDD